MRKLLILCLVALALILVAPTVVAIPTAAPTLTPTPEELLAQQKLGSVWPANPVKYAIRGAVSAGVPANTIVLLLLLPIVAFIIAVTRNVVGIRGFGIFLPAALSVVFLAIGPILGISLFLLIVAISTLVRLTLRKLGAKLQYLPRMALIFWAVVIGVLGVLFAAPVIKSPALTNVSIFAVLILILLAEDFTRVQLGKSVRTAVSLTSETLIIALVSYIFLTLKPLQNYILLHPEITLLTVGVLDFSLAKYSGLRLMEIWRFRKLIKQ